MKVTLFAYDLSDNSFGRVALLAEAIADRYDVEIVGPARNGELWGPLRAFAWPVKLFPWTAYPGFVDLKRKMARAAAGEVLIACKPRATSLSVAVAAKMIEPRPLIADVDDWELGFFHHKRLLRKLSSALDVLDPAAPLHTARSERLLRHADAIMVSNRFLQARYGGTIVRHCRDTQVLDPRKWDPSELRSQLGWRDEKVVMFLGTPRAHKGLEILLEAMRHVQNPAVHLAIVGASASDRLRLRSSAPNVSVLGEIAMADVPRYVAAADAFVVPQSASAASWGQLPAKVFDAMAMGKPLIATEVSDIPEDVGDSGYLVAPDDPRALARAIDLVFADPALAARKGTLARQRCVELFDRGVMAKQIADVIESARDQFRR